MLSCELHTHVTFYAPFATVSNERCQSYNITSYILTFHPLFELNGGLEPEGKEPALSRWPPNFEYALFVIGPRDGPLWAAAMAGFGRAGSSRRGCESHVVP